MCGFTGIVDQSHFISHDMIRRMTDTIIHRGPDSDGYYVNGNAALGHRRLSIIDLESGDQPFHNEDQSLRLVYNGEIYNYRELTERLKDRGHTFCTKSDGEIILHLYEEYGDDCVKHLRGMFAFALLDERRSRLLLARDRIGKKPLYYYHRSGRFIFGSEIKAILCADNVNREMSFKAVDDYLKFGYIPAPYTIYRHIKKLMPAYLLVYENNQLMTRRYWDLGFTEDGPNGETEVLAEIERMLLESVRLRMLSDVPLGAFLSGGLDSSLVVAMMSRISGRRVKTFTIGFEEDDYSELKYARRVAAHLNTEHYEEILEPDIMEILDDLLEQYDEPFADSSMIPTYLVSRMAHEHVKVALTGDGGDEVFAGYNRYANFDLARRQLDWIPGIKILAGAASRFPVMSASVRRKLKIISQPTARWQLSLSSVTSEAFRREAYTDQFRSQVAQSEPSEPEKLYLSGPNRLNKWLYGDLMAYLPNDILVKVDRASMRASLETRSPLLDHHLIEFMATIPEGLKIRKNITKYLLKKLAERYLPREIIYREKMGFMIPAQYWFRGPLKDIAAEKLFSSHARIKRILRQEVIGRMFKEHLDGFMDHGGAIYSLLYLELWLERYAPNF
jgi:asparagine synthase (glutamine-hydrolysing)